MRETPGAVLRMGTFLLTVHVLAAAAWLGGAAYERFVVVPDIRRGWGTSGGWNVLRLMLRPERLVMGTVAVLALTGVAMAILGHDGFFHVTWVGAKQAVLACIVIGYLGAVRPDLSRLKADVERCHRGAAPEPGLRRRFERVVSRLDLIHAGIVLNVVLAVWKPGS